MEKKSISQYRKQASAYMKTIYSGVRGNFAKLGRELTSIDKAYERLDQLTKDLDIKKLENKKILEIGSGFGVTLYACAQRGAYAYGIEPDQIAYRLSKTINKSFIQKKQVFIQEGVGESLPYKDNSFDIVMSFQVLEHVQSPAKVVKEAMRVLKKGGKMYFVIPNYHSFWEGHYEVLWFPSLLLWKPLAKAYLKIFYRKKNLSFLDTLNNITPQLIQKLFHKNKKGVELMSLGKEKFSERMKSHSYSPQWGGTSKLIFFKKIAVSLGVAEVIAKVFNKMNYFYPIVVTARKRK